MEQYTDRMVITSTCWLWVGTKTTKGYGIIYLNRSGKRIAQLRAHRVSYETYYGKIPEGMVVDHLCRVRNCVNPAHLEAVTIGENVLRGTALSAINRQKLYCKHGHMFNKDNTVIRLGGGRTCLTCKRRRARELKAKRKQKLLYRSK